jgi:hypothetical protein
MSGVALHAQEGLGDFQQRVIGRAVRAVTIRAFFGYVGVLIDERALVLHVAASA